MPRKPVWARKHVWVSTCPKSYVTAESEALLEEFFVRKRLGGIRPEELDARRTEAFLILEGELVAEIQNERDTGSSL